MNDTQLSDALKAALVAKKERLAKLRTLHAAAGRPNRVPEDPNQPLPLPATRRPPLKRSVPQRPKAKTTKYRPAQQVPVSNGNVRAGASGLRSAGGPHAVKGRLGA